MEKVKSDSVQAPVEEIKLRIKVEPFLQKKGDKVAKAAIEFQSSDGILAGFLLVGFTICDDPTKGLFVLFPASFRDPENQKDFKNKMYFFLRPENPELLDKLEELILDVYEDMTKSKVSA